MAGRAKAVCTRWMRRSPCRPNATRTRCAHASHKRQRNGRLTRVVTQMEQHTGAHVPKRQVEELGQRAAQDFVAF